mgnify:CR=1 FL=1
MGNGAGGHAPAAQGGGKTRTSEQHCLSMERTDLTRPMMYGWAVTEATEAAAAPLINWPKAWAVSEVRADLPGIAWRGM